MSPTNSNRLLVTALVIVLLIGVIDAVIGGEWDLFATLVMALVIGLVLLVRLESRRPAVPIRRDLVVWMRERASSGGEPLSVVADRAVATFMERYGVMTDPGKAQR